MILRAAGLSSFRNFAKAVPVYSIVQAKLFSHIGVGVNGLITGTYALKNLGGKVVVLDILKPLLNHLTDVERLRAASLACQEIQSALNIRMKLNRCSHHRAPSQSVGTPILSRSKRKQIGICRVRWLSRPPTRLTAPDHAGHSALRYPP
jgi:hypothetical protein